MSTRATARLAWALAALSVLIFLASVALCVLLLRSALAPDSSGGDLPVAVMLLYLPFLAFSIVGAFIASARSENPVGWILLADGLLWMLVSVTDFYGVYGLVGPGSVPFPLVMAGINNWLWVPEVGLLGTYLLLLFPDGKLPSRRWRSLTWLSGAVILVLSVGVMLAPDRLQNLGGARNPFGLEGAHWLTAGAYTVLPLLPLCMLASALSLVLRFRRSSGEERQQIKWIAFAASIVVVVYVIAMIASFIFPSDSWSTAGSVWWLNLLTYAVLLSFTTIPIAVGFAVLKYRLYEIDLIINRALVYGSLTVLLGASYARIVICVQYVLRAATGQDSTLAVVASTLAIAALFGPLRRRVQTFVDRRFYRRKYDAAKTLAAFSARLREQTDLDALGDAVVEVARDTMQPEHVSLWLRPQTTSEAKRAD
jgi:hypothetical protein